MAIRGSEKMLKARALDERALDRLIGLSESREIDLVEWFPRGIPAVDTLGGAFRAPVSEAGMLIQKILEIEDIRVHIEIFPYGIPNPEGVFVNFRTP